MGFGKIKLDPNDILFSKMVRERAGGRCIFCPKTAAGGWRMTNSHYWARGDKVHRFDTRNCDCVCVECHLKVEGNKQGEYREYKLKQLGEEVYNKMQQDHYSKTKQYGKYEKAKLNKILKEQYENKDHLKPNWTVEW